MPHLAADVSHLSPSLDDDDFVRLVRTMVDGYEAMSEELKRCQDLIRSVERRLEWEHTEYKSLASRYAVAMDHPLYSERERYGMEDESGSGETHEELVLDALGTFLNHQQHRAPARDVSPVITAGREAQRRIIEQLGWDSETERHEESFKTRAFTSSGDNDAAASQNGTAPRDTHGLADRDSLSQDRSSAMRCPFATSRAPKPADHPSLPAPVQHALRSQHEDHTLSLNQPGRVGEGESLDPIKANNAAGGFISPPLSASGSASKCPIRYLDQVSPEEVAHYFEKHKHELPRSHEVCVKRYQSNTESIRQLDAKYGNLVTMIQGLGMKHQPLLPAKADHEEATQDDKQINERVERWAETLSGQVNAHNEATIESEDRTGHFDRPMKEIRVGESPNRPWGIAVPLEAEENNPSITSQREMKDHYGSHHSDEPTRTRDYSGDRSAHVNSGARFKAAGASPQPAASSEQQSRMVFTGPVFIGYSNDQIMTFLHQTGADVNIPRL